MGNSADEVLASLRKGRSGIRFIPKMKELGFKCNVYGLVKDLDRSLISKKSRQTMSDAAFYACIAAFEALKNAGLAAEDLHSNRTGIIVGTGLGGINHATLSEQILEKRNSLSRAGGVAPVKIMNSTASGNLASVLGVQGRAYSFSSACCTGGDNIGHAYELLKFGVLDVCIAGSSEEDSWEKVGASFDNSREMPKDWNEFPNKACRPYDRDRQGFVLASGSGILILEELEHALRRGAKIYAEIVGYGTANDGKDLFRPNGDGLNRAIMKALKTARGHGAHKIDYINTHGTGTQIGDEVEIEVIKLLFGASPSVGSTKGLTGHALGASASLESVCSLMMLDKDFISATVNLDNIAPECMGVKHIQELQEVSLKTVMNINSGLGGTNTCLIFKKF
jgi:3-oxoacyl-[acyl-carrier-protein] synthase-1